MYTILNAAAVAVCIWMDGLAAAAFTASSSRQQALVPRITLEEFLAAPKRFKALPIIIRDIVSPDVIESLADELMRTLGDEEIQMQHKVKNDDGKTTTEIYDISLSESVEYMMDSQHDDSFFAFVEGLFLNPFLAQPFLTRPPA